MKQVAHDEMGRLFEEYDELAGDDASSSDGVPSDGDGGEHAQIRQTNGGGYSATTSAASMSNNNNTNGHSSKIMDSPVSNANGKTETVTLASPVS